MKKTRKLQVDDILAGALAGAVAGLAAVAFMGTLVVIGVCVPVGLFVAQSRRNYLAALSERIDVQGVYWDVQINGVKVGTVSDAEYARIRQEVFTDRRVYIAQLANLAWCASKVIDSLFISVPIAAFWLVVGLAVVDANAMGDLVRALQALPPAQLVSGLRSWLWVIPMFGLLYVVLNVLIVGSRFGFVNRFTERSDERLRRRLSVPTVGQVTLLRFQDNGVVFNDEAAYLVRRRN